MFPLPLFRVRINTRLAPGEAASLLARNLYAPRPLAHFFSGKWLSGKGFEGSVSNGSFRFSRAITYRNSFLPFAYGRIQPADHGSVVTAVFTLHPAVAIAEIGILAFVASQYVASALRTAPSSSVGQGWPGAWIVLVFMLLVTTIAFWLEAPGAKNFLRRVYGPFEDAQQAIEPERAQRT